MSSNCRGENLLLKEEHSDVVIRVQGDDTVWRFPAHSLFLRCGSNILEQGIVAENSAEEEQEETDNRGKREIILVGIPPGTVLLLLEYLYTMKLPHIRYQIELLRVLSASIRLQMRDLQNECEIRLLKNIRIDNACQILRINADMIASGYGSICIANACLRIVRDYGHIVFSSDYILHLHRDHLATVLASRTLNVAEEKVVFEGLWRWGKHMCLKSGKICNAESIADELGDLLRLVRYSSLKGVGLPRVVRERFCRQTTDIGCCLMDDRESVPRLCYHNPQDLLRQSTRFLLFYPSAPAYPNITSISAKEGLDDRRLMCARVSFDSDLFMMALAIQVFMESSGTSITDQFFVSVSDCDVELVRQDVYWDEEQRLSTMDRVVLSATVRLPFPLAISCDGIYTLHLYRQEVTANEGQIANPDRWKFPATAVEVPGQSRSVAQFCAATFHCERIAAISAIYFIPVEIRP